MESAGSDLEQEECKQTNESSNDIYTTVYKATSQQMEEQATSELVVLSTAATTTTATAKSKLFLIVFSYF